MAVLTSNAERIKDVLKLRGYDPVATGRARGSGSIYQSGKRWRAAIHDAMGKRVFLSGGRRKLRLPSWPPSASIASASSPNGSRPARRGRTAGFRSAPLWARRSTACCSTAWRVCPETICGHADASVCGGPSQRAEFTPRRWGGLRGSNPQPSDPQSDRVPPLDFARVRQAFYFTREWRSKCPLPSGGVRSYPQAICCQICCQAASS